MPRPPRTDWVKLAVTRARASGHPAIFWLNPARAHDAQLIAKVKTYLAQKGVVGERLEVVFTQTDGAPYVDAEIVKVE